MFVVVGVCRWLLLLFVCDVVVVAVCVCRCCLSLCALRYCCWLRLFVWSVCLLVALRVCDCVCCCLRSLLLFVLLFVIDDVGCVCWWLWLSLCVFVGVCV